MSALQDAFERRNKKINKVEKLKSEQSAVDFINDFETICSNSYENLTDAQSKHFLKCFGIYDKGSSEEFAMRVRIPFGQLTLDQAKTICKTVKDYAQSRIDLTTRSQIEFRHIKFEDLPTVLDNLNSVGLTTYQTAGDNLRGVVTSPFDGYSQTCLIECKPLVEQIQDVFLKNADLIGTLPRKFNTGILGDTKNDCNIYGQDCAFVLAKKDEVLGFNLYLGGKVGVQASPTNLFVKPEEVKTVFASLIDIFKTYGFRDNRNKNRLCYFIEEIGLEVLEDFLVEKSGLDIKGAGEVLVKDEFIISNSEVIKLKDAKSAVYFPIPAGLFNSRDLHCTTKLMDETNSILRFTNEQSFFLITDEQNVKTIKDAQIFKKYDAYNSVFFRNQIACAGVNECSFGVIQNKLDAIEMAIFLNQYSPINEGKIRMYWSACPKGCGVHGVADIGFEGAIAKDEKGEKCEGVKIFLGGKATSQVKEARQISKAIPMKKAQIVVKNLVTIYNNEKFENETFESFDTRVLSKLSVEEIQEKIGL